MKLAPINEYYSPNFRAVKSIGNYTEKQMVLDLELKNILKEPHKDLKNQTPEKYYGSKGFDFVIQPLSTDMVTLSMRKDLRIVRTGVERSYTWSEEIDVGEHYDNNPLNVDDIINAYKTHKGNQHTLIGVFGAAIIAFSLIGLSQCKGNKAASMQNIEKIGAMTDSIYNKVANILK